MIQLGRKIKVLIIDDSALVRQVLSSILTTDPEIEILGASADPLFAEKHLKTENWPDVIVLDIEMPRMDGLTFLGKIMKEHPTPVVMCSALTEEGTEATMQALSAGAVEIITKPKIGLKDFLTDSGEMLIEAVKSASQARLSHLSGVSVRTPPAPKPAPRPAAPKPAAPKPAASSPPPKASPSIEIRPKLPTDAVLPLHKNSKIPLTGQKIIAIGASTGGTQAIEAVLKQLPLSVHGIVIVQHMPEKFTKAFADRLNNICQVNVKEAEDNDEIKPGHVLIAPGNYHMMVKRHGQSYRVAVVEGPLVNRHRPSVDVLFRSAANEAGPNALGVILTGMGDDGATGMLEMKEAGAQTIAQDESSCVVFGMPKEAIAKGGTNVILPLDKIPEIIARYEKSSLPL